MFFLCQGGALKNKKNTKIKLNSTKALDGRHLIFYTQQPTKNTQA
jgi:hypothetical protein